MNNKELYVGVMSGTSLDGIDVALCETSGDTIKMIAHLTYPIPQSIKQSALNMCLGQQTTLIDVGTLDHQLGQLYADAILQLLQQESIPAEKVRAIGNHGQTVFHQPNGGAPFTLQIGDANIIAARTQIDTVADFRRKDMALGGQGAPLVPAFHNTIFSSTDSTVVVLNIGGIANISVLRPNSPVIGYDTGPGNMLMDIWCSEQKKEPYDQDAQFALSGEVNIELLKHFLNEIYFSQPSPKSTGRELFNLEWLNNKLAKFHVYPADVQRTLCELTATSICSEVELFSLGPSPELLVCGGGVSNPLLMQRLRALLPSWKVQSTDDKGVSSDFMEAIAFAWLAQRRIHGLPSNLPEVTGASQQASLGVIYPAN